MLEQPAFGHRLRELRLERGLSQAALASGGLSTGYLSRLESGDRPPTSRIVGHLAERLGVPVSAFEKAMRPPSSLAQILAVACATDGEPPEALAETLRADDNGDPALHWQALWLLARSRGARGRYEDERDLLAELVPLSDELGSPDLRVRARIALSRCLQALGDDNTAARNRAAEAYGLAADLPPADQAAALHALVSAEAEAGRLVEARAHADELCTLTEPLGGAEFVRALWASATVRTRQADYAGAGQVLERALQQLDSHEDLTLWLRLRLAAASLYLQIAPPRAERARARLDEAAPVVELVGTELHRQQLLTLRAHLAFEEGRADDARALCRQIDENALQLSFRDALKFRALCAQLLILDGRIDQGTRALQELAQQAQDSLNVELAAEIWRGLAKTLADVYGKGGQDMPAQPLTPA